PRLTTKNPVACTLPSGSGNSATRNTSSSTMMPVQRMRGASAGAMSIKNPAAILDKAANEMVGDGDWRRRGQPVGMTALQHRGELVAMKPARVLDLGPADDEGAR